MLAVLELKGTDTQAFDDAVEELARVVNHHLTEEELTILNPGPGGGRRPAAGPSWARSSRPSATGRSTTAAVRSRRSAAWWRRRRREGLLDEDDEKDEGEKARRTGAGNCSCW
jgi:hypothetical protein